MTLSVQGLQEFRFRLSAVVQISIVHFRGVHLLSPKRFHRSSSSYCVNSQQSAYVLETDLLHTFIHSIIQACIHAFLHAFMPSFMHVLILTCTCMQLDMCISIEALLNTSFPDVLMLIRYENMTNSGQAAVFALSPWYCRWKGSVPGFEG